MKTEPAALRHLTGANVQLIVLIGTIFLVPALAEKYQEVGYKIGFTLMLIVTAYSLQVKGKVFLTLVAVILILLEWGSMMMQFPLLHEVSQWTKALYFIFIVGMLIRQTAAAKRVTELVIADSISGYLLLGMVFTLGTVMISNWDDSAYTFSKGTSFSSTINMNHFIYYTFVTYTTTGYGDLLPVSPAARSFSIFIAASGQLYIATIIALLVGKYAGSGKGTN